MTNSELEDRLRSYKALKALENQMIDHVQLSHVIRYTVRNMSDNVFILAILERRLAHGITSRSVQLR